MQIQKLIYRVSVLQPSDAGQYAHYFFAAKLRPISILNGHTSFTQTKRELKQRNY